MSKKILIIFLFIVMLTGCGKKDITEKFYLTEKYYNDGSFIEIKNVENIKKESYLLYTYNNYCSLQIPCEEIFKSAMEEYKIDMLSIPFDDFKSTYLYEEVKYAPSIVIVKKGKIVTYLDANSDSDLDKYQDLEAFKKWLETYIYITKD